MNNLIKKHGSKLQAVALILMLVIPFLLYTATIYGSVIQLKLLLVLMIGTMLFAMMKG